MAGAVAVQVAREDVFEKFEAEATQPRLEATPAPSVAGEQQPVVAEARSDVPREEAQVPVVTCEANAAAPEPPTEASANGGALEQGAQQPPGPIVVPRHTKLAPFKPGRMTVVLDMDECLLHSKFHGPGAASEAYRQLEERPDAVNEVNSFWVALDDGDTAQVNKRPGLDPFLEALARDYNTIVFTAAMPDYAGPVLDYIDPKGTLFHRRLYRSSCRQVKGAFLKDLSVLGLESADMSRTVLVDNNPLSFICQPTNGILVASFYDDPNDTALASVMQLIRHLDHAGDVRPILKDMFRLDTLLGEYRSALFDDDEDVDCILDEEDGGADEQEEEEELLESCVEEGAEAAAAAVTAASSTGGADAGEDLVLDVSRAEAQKENDTSRSSSSSGGGGNQAEGKCRLKDREVVSCGGTGKDDDDDESVKTEPCSEGSGDSSLGDESLSSREEITEMELELEF
eukprot:g14673.t1